MKRMFTVAFTLPLIFLAGHSWGQESKSANSVKGEGKLPIPGYAIPYNFDGWLEFVEVVKTSYDADRKQTVWVLQAKKDTVTAQGEMERARFLDEDGVNLEENATITFSPNANYRKKGERIRAFLKTPSDEILKKTKKVLVGAAAEKATGEEKQSSTKTRPQQLSAFRGAKQGSAVAAPGRAATKNEAEGLGVNSAKPSPQKSYRKTAERVQELVLLRVCGLMSKGKSDDDFGRTSDVRVADNLTVSNVPIEFLEGCTDAALVQVSALGLFPESKDAASLRKALEKNALDKRAAARALVAWWSEDILAEWQVDAKANVPTRKLLQLDGERTQMLKSLRSSPTGVLSAQWLLFPMGLDTFSPTKQARKPVSFQILLGRFNPDAPVTEMTAEAVAEELIWTRRIGLTDGTVAKLPDSRKTFQALILERLGFEIGDPISLDKSKREAAQQRLAASMKVCAEVWKTSPAALR